MLKLANNMNFVNRQRGIAGLFLSFSLVIASSAFTISLLCSVKSALGWASNGKPMDAASILEHIDDLYRSESSFSELEMAIITPYWQRTLKMQTWTSGRDKTFIRIASPKKEKGIATLRIGGEMWNYLPKVNKVIRIPPSMMMSSWMGSDFTNDDLVDEYTLRNDYTSKFIYPEDRDTSLYYIECIPREGLPIVWGKILAVVRKNDLMPIMEKYYDEKNNVMRILKFSEVRRFGDRKLPAVMEMVPLSKKGHKTVVRYIKAEFNLPLDRDTFTLRNLRSK